MTISTPGLLGPSHITFSVADLDAHTDFWTRIFGLELLASETGFRFLIERGLRLAILLVDHDGSVKGPFDERNVGLDHLALAVPDVESLLAWQQRLTELNVPHTPMVESDGGHHLNVRAPDNLPIELYVIAPSLLATVGAIGPEEAVAVSPY